MTGREKRDVAAYLVFIIGAAFLGWGVYSTLGEGPFLILIGVVMMVSAIYGASN